MLIRYFHRPLVWFALVAALVFGAFVLGAVGQAHAGSEYEGLLLPNLVATPPDNASIETSYDEGGLRKETVPAELLLRFNGYVHNDGEGALDFEGSRQAPKIQSPSVKEEIVHREEELEQ